MKYISNNARHLVAEEAARLLHEEGYRDYLVAKNKASQRLGITNHKKAQPSNIEIHEALVERIGLYATEEEKEHLKQLRIIALEAMEFLSKYKPVLVGPVLTGTAGLHTPVTLHLFAPVSEDVIIFLDDSQIPFQTHERKFQMKNRSEYLPLLRFFVDDYEVELILFDDDHRSMPKCPVFGKSIVRASIGQVRELLN